MCFGGSKEPSHRDGSFEYPQHMFWLRNKKNNFQIHTLIWGPVNREAILLYQVHTKPNSLQHFDVLFKVIINKFPIIHNN